MSDEIYISGHKNPDSDSICAAIAYSELKNRMGSGEKYIPVRLGEPSRETQFILNYFNAESPKYIKTIRPQVSDLQIDEVNPISPEISLKMAWSIMKKYDVKTLPVVDENSKLLGLASASNLIATFMDVWDNNIISKSNTKLDNIVDTLSSKIVYINDNNLFFKGKVVIAAMNPDSEEEHIEQGDIVLCGNRKEIQLTSIQNGATLLIVSGNHPVDADVIASAKEKGASIIITPHDTFTASRLIIQSIPISFIMSKNKMVAFTISDYIEDIKEVMLKTRHRSYPVINKDNKVIGSVSRYHLISQRKKKIILVDHNEKNQAVDGIEEADILEIIDHHRVANVETSNPIYYRCEPVGSTSTIIASLYFENGIRPSKKVAGILSGAIISDTLLLKSPTTTITDRLILKRLLEIADLNAEKFAQEMFKAGTSLKGKTLEQIFYQDFKTFVIDGRKVAISQINTMDMEGFEPMKKDMLSLMKKNSELQGFNLILLLLTDIYNEGSLILAVGKDMDAVNIAFNVTLVDNCVFAPGIVSRKKQVIPPLTNAIESLK